MFTQNVYNAINARNLLMMKSILIPPHEKAKASNHSLEQERRDYEKSLNVSLENE
jgi:hypothetical protein